MNNERRKTAPKGRRAKENKMKTITKMPARVEKAIVAVLMTRAKWETVDSIDKETRDEILLEHDFRNEDTNERITERNSDFLMSEADFESYCKLAYSKNCEKGLDSGSWELNFWPIKKAVYEAEDALIDAIALDVPQHYTPEVVSTVKRSPKQREKFLAILGL